MNYHQLTTVICPTSPSPSHPDTRIIDETLLSIRHWFPTAPIYILADGVRYEQAHRREQYKDYLNTLVLPGNLPVNTWVFPYDTHHHQTAMVQNILPQVDTPLLLWIEHDQPIRIDVSTDWQMMADAILSGRVDLCRLMLHEGIHPEHIHLYNGPVDGYPHLFKQSQFSGWPHLASADMYRRLLKDFDCRARIMVERYVGRIIEAHPWSDFKLTSYIPDPIAARRTYHLHGRGDDPTFVETECYPPK